MSLLAPSISLRVLESSDQATVFIQDITGDYNAVSNPGGWAESGAAGRINLAPDTTDLSALQILVYDAENTLLSTIDIVLDDDTNVYAIEKLRGDGITFDANTLFGSSYAQDGYYQFVYKITPQTVVSGEVYQATNHQAFLAEHTASVAQLAQYVTYPDYDVKKIDDIHNAHIMLDGADRAGSTADYSRFNSIITELNQLLEDYDIPSTTTPIYQ